jgi:hypothetical protein
MKSYKLFENPKYGTNRSFLDFMFILVCCLTLFFVVTLLQILKNSEGVVHKAEFIATMTWPKDDLNDMDLWVKDPNGNIIFYKDKEKGGVMFLDRDDLGFQNDTITINGEQRIILINQEIVSIRAIIPGRWIIAVHFYKRHDGKPPGTPIPVTVRLDKINPKVKIVFQEEVVMKDTWQEETVAIFEVLPDGTVINIQFDDEMPIVHERLPIQLYGPNSNDHVSENTSRGISHPVSTMGANIPKPQLNYRDPLGDEEFASKNLGWNGGI